MIDLATHLEKHECQLLMEETSHEELRELNKEIPTDTHLVRYTLDGEAIVSGIRAYKMSDIFNCLYDRGCEVQEIVQGYGAIKPKLYGIQQIEEG